MLLAGIDIGTNTLRLLIVRFSPDGRYHKIESSRKITRLGEDISWTGQLKPEPIERTIRVLEGFSRVCRNHPLDGIYAVATSAVREASNGAEFIRMVKTRTGFEVDIISGDEEARLTLLGVSSGLDIGDKEIFLMDIGGGSTEFISASCGKIHFKVSTDIGVVRFTERYIHSDPPETGELELLESAIEERLKALPALVKGDRFIFPETGKINMSPFTFIGTAGTVTTLAAIEQKMAVYDPDKINGYRMSKKRVGEMRGMLSRMTIKERKDLPGIETGREDIIVTGAVVVDKVMEWFRFPEIIVSDSGLREGVVIDLYKRLSQT